MISKTEPHSLGKGASLMESALIFVLVVACFRADSFDLVVHNISEAETEVDVTGYVGSHHNLVTLFNDSSTWFDSREKCVDLGYSRLDDALHNWYRWRTVAQTFREFNIPVNYTFWNGIFRPSLNTTSWYRGNGGSDCIDVILANEAVNEQCISGRFVDLYSYPVFTADNCTALYPFICYKWFGNVTINIYHGFDIELISSNLTAVEISNITLVIDCATECQKNGKTVSFTYNFTSLICILYRVSNFYGEITYRIVRSIGNVTHGAKVASMAGYSSKITNSTLQPDYYTVPDCNIESVPDNHTMQNCTLESVPENHCLCEVQNYTSEELEVIVNELIKNLTIDSSTTFKNKQKYVSLKDERTSSKVSGSVAIAIIVIVLAAPVISDVLLFIQKQEEKRKILKTGLSSERRFSGWSQNNMDLETASPD